MEEEVGVHTRITPKALLAIGVLSFGLFAIVAYFYFNPIYTGNAIVTDADKSKVLNQLSVGTTTVSDQTKLKVLSQLQEKTAPSATLTDEAKSKLLESLK